GDTAQGRRLANGAAGVGGGGGGGEAGGHGGGGTTGGAPGDTAGVPGVLHRAVPAGLVGGAHGELIHIGLAQHHRAGGEEILHHRGVVGGHKVVEHFRGAAGAHPLGAKDVLVGDGHPAQGVHRIARGPQLVGGGGAGQGALMGDGNKAVVGAVQSLDAGQKVPGQLDAGKVSGGKAGAQLREGLVVHGLGRPYSITRGTR